MSEQARKPIEFTNLGGTVYVVEDGAGGAIGISREQIEQLIEADDETRAALLAKWRTEGKRS